MRCLSFSLSLPAKILRSQPLGHRPGTPIRSDLFSSNPKPAIHSDLLPLANLFKQPPDEARFIHYIRIYGKTGAMYEATQLFDKMPELKCTPTAASLNQLLSILCDKKEGLYMVKDVLLKSHEMGIRVDRSTFWVLIEALCRHGKAKFAIEIMCVMGLFECNPDPKMYSLVLKSFCDSDDSNSWSDVIAFVGEMRNAGSLLTNSDCYMVIDLLVKEEKMDEAYCLVTEMRIDGTNPDINCFNKLLSGFCQAGRFDMVDKVFDEMLIGGMVPNVHTFEIYIDGLAKKGDVDGMVKMVKCMERAGFNANVQIYNTMIGQFMRSGKSNEARELMDEMVKKGIEWNSDH